MRNILSNIKTYLVLGCVALIQPHFSHAETASLGNPLVFGNTPESNGIADLILAIINIFRIVSVPIIVFFVIYSGFLFVVARGNPETLDRAKKALLYAIIGGVIIAGASAIGIIVQNTTTEFTG